MKRSGFESRPPGLFFAALPGGCVVRLPPSYATQGPLRPDSIGKMYDRRIFSFHDRLPNTVHHILDCIVQETFYSTCSKNCLKEDEVALGALSRSVTPGTLPTLGDIAPLHATPEGPDSV